MAFDVCRASANVCSLLLMNQRNARFYSADLVDVFMMNKVLDETVEQSTTMNPGNFEMRVSMSSSILNRDWSRWGLLLRRNMSSNLLGAIEWGPDWFHRTHEAAVFLRLPVVFLADHPALVSSRDLKTSSTNFPPPSLLWIIQSIILLITVASSFNVAEGSTSSVIPDLT